MLDVSFRSHRVTCAAWHLPATSDGFTSSAAGRPCVVMAHGFGGTRDTGLLAYAEGFAAAGLDVLVFDYRGFGDSGGTPRQRVSYRRQRADFHAAIAAARAMDGIDPDRIVLWGTSYSGGHVVPVVGEPGSAAIITSPGALDGYTALAGQTWRNEVCARTALEVAFNRPTRFAGRVRFPLLVQIGENDSVAPPTAAHRAATKAGRHATVQTYPVDHFDVYDGHWQHQVLADQLSFLGQNLSQHVNPTQKVSNS